MLRTTSLPIPYHAALYCFISRRIYEDRFKGAINYFSEYLTEVLTINRSFQHLRKAAVLPRALVVAARLQLAAPVVKGSRLGHHYQCSSGNRSLIRNIKKLMPWSPMEKAKDKKPSSFRFKIWVLFSNLLKMEAQRSHLAVKKVCTHACTCIRIQSVHFSALS